MINVILNGIIGLITNLVNVVLSPIDALITTYLPSLDSALSSISYFFNIVSQDIGWVISSLGVPSTAISLLITYWTFKLTVPLLISTIKLAIKWYDKLKP